MKMQFIVEVNVMHVKGLATQLAQVGLINPIKLINVLVVVETRHKQTVVAVILVKVRLSLRILIYSRSFRGNHRVERTVCLILTDQQTLILPSKYCLKTVTN